ncbi:hypothetical protein LCGC14_1348600 [marine sediment metagenome]|uniref:Uncharacterized protein n=1 Tax=marine sediment metagenome TaxID=412755 RepID=A0A0F9KC71_9ZZZZ
MPDSPNPLTFTMADFERVLNLWGCKLTEPVFMLDGPPSILAYPMVQRGVFSPGGKKMTLNYTEATVRKFRDAHGDEAEHNLVASALIIIHLDLHRIGTDVPSPDHALAMIRMFDALESVYPQTELLARDAEMSEFMDDFKWGLAAGVAIGLALDDPSILSED